MRAPERVVLDTSVAVKWYFDEPYTERALAIRDFVRSGRCAALAPDLIYPEFANAVWKRAMFERLDPDEGAAVVAAFADVPLEIVPGVALAMRAYRLGVECRRPVDDALFLALAVELDAELVTADEPFFRAVQATYPRVRWLGSWPG